MNTTIPRPLEGEEDDFDQELTGLYRTALLDEDFQQQVKQALQTLPDTSLADLNAPEQAFVQEESLSAATKARLLDMTPTCNQQAARTPQPVPWWRQLLAANWASSILPGPAISIPGALVVGALFGALLPTLLTMLNQPDYVTRGDKPDQTAISQQTDQAVMPGGITDAVRQNPQQWLAAIAELVRHGKVPQARTELQKFELQYLNYQPQ